MAKARLRRWLASSCWFVLSFSIFSVCRVSFEVQQNGASSFSFHQGEVSGLHTTAHRCKGQPIWVSNLKGHRGRNLSRFMPIGAKRAKAHRGHISTSRVWSSSSAAVCGTCVVVVSAYGYSCFPTVVRNVCLLARLRQTTHVTGLGWHTALWSCWHGVCSADHRQTAVLWFRRSNKPTIKTHPGRSMLKRSLRLIVRTLRDSRGSPCERVAWRNRDHVSGSPGAPRDRLPQS